MTEKTEQPTPKKLRDAREKGDVPQSKEVGKALLLLGFVIYLTISGKQIVSSISNMVRWAGNHAYAPFSVVLDNFLDMVMRELISSGIPFVIIIIFISVLAEILQAGVVFAPEKIKPSFKKLDVISNVKNLFSMKNLLEGCKSILKVLILTWILWRIIRDNIGPLILLPESGIHALGTAFATLLNNMLISSAIIFLIVALLDILLQRHLFFKQQRMSKDEVKKEYKENDGDPHIKQHRKELHKELLMEERKQAVRKSSAIVVNPIHFAVALRYEAEETALPVVMAKGEGAYARAIVEEATDAGVPIIQNIPLAHALMADAELDDYVPSHLLHAVVEVLQAVRDMRPDWHD